jgi:Flp pilus assembly pilin Flp
VRKLATFLKQRVGATAIEYAFIASMIAAVLAVTIGLLGQDLKGAYQAIVDMFP